MNRHIPSIKNNREQKNLVMQAKNEKWKEFGETMENNKKRIKNYFIKY